MAGAIALAVPAAAPGQLPPVPTPQLPPVPVPPLPVPVPPVPVPPVSAPQLPPAPVPVPSVPQVPVPSTPSVPGVTGPRAEGRRWHVWRRRRERERQQQQQRRRRAGRAARPVAMPDRLAPAARAARRAPRRAPAPPLSARPPSAAATRAGCAAGVTRLSGCLDELSTGQRRVLVLRAGLGARAGTASRRAVARRLDITVRRVGRLERSGLRQARALSRAGACGGSSGRSWPRHSQRAREPEPSPPRASHGNCLRRSSGPGEPGFGSKARHAYRACPQQEHDEPHLNTSVATLFIRHLMTLRVPRAAGLPGTI